LLRRVILLIRFAEVVFNRTGVCLSSSDGKILSIPMPGNKAEHRAQQKVEGKAEYPPDAAAAPESSNVHSLKSSQALSPSAAGPLSASNASETLGSPYHQERGIHSSKHAEGSVASHWDKVRSSTLGNSASIDDGLKAGSTESSEDLYAAQHSHALIVLKL
jgi:hypothetical protein